MTRILVVEDEESISEMLALNFELEGYDVTVCDNGKQALEVFRNKRFDLLILDVMLPELDGFSVCQTIRLEDQHVPILMLTAKNSSTDRVDGLKIGADDYLAKPFNLEELLLRVTKLLQRSQSSGNEEIVTVFDFSAGRINFATYEVEGRTGKQTLSKRQIMLLRLLIDRKGQVVSRQEILEKVWGFDVYPTTRTIDNYIVEFRKLFEKDSRHPKHFQSIRGVGYRFVE